MLKINGLGIDIVDSTRLEFDDPLFAKRFMTNQEYQAFLNCDNNSKHNFMVGIWCLKEAIIKATNHQFMFSDISISFTNEAPICILPNWQLFLSISYEKVIAVAIAIGFINN